MKNVAVLPTLVTLGNLFCGFAAIVYLAMAKASPEQFKVSIELAGWLVLAALVFDALDGKLARLAHMSSDFGAQLDSLSDLVSFGVAPALMIQIMAKEVGILPRVAWVTSVLFVLCAALRLARFTVEARPEEEAHAYFEGLPAPAAGGFVASMFVMYFNLSADKQFGAVAERLQPTMRLLVQLMPVLAVALAILMVSRVQYVHAFYRLLKGKEPFDYVAKIVLLVMFAVLTKPFSVPIGFGVYILSGLIGAVRRRVRQRRTETATTR